MAFDAEAGGDPRGPWCPKCQKPVKPGEPATRMHFASDPDGSKGLSGRLWHGECARPMWDTVTPALERLSQWMATGGFGAPEQPDRHRQDDGGPELAQG